MNKLFSEVCELMDDASSHLPEGLYMNLYNKLRDIKNFKEEEDKETRGIEHFNTAMGRDADDWRPSAQERREIFDPAADLAFRALYEARNLGSTYRPGAHRVRGPEAEFSRSLESDSDDELSPLPPSVLYRRAPTIRPLSHIAVAPQAPMAVVVVPEPVASPPPMPIVNITVRRCRCGSTTHMRTNHRDCRLRTVRRPPVVPVVPVDEVAAS